MPRARSKTLRRENTPKRALPKEAVSLTDWECWPLVESGETLVYAESKTSFWRRQAAIHVRDTDALGHSRGGALRKPGTPIAQALFLCKAQAKFLDKTREALRRMQELAILAQQSPAEGREACLEEFDTLVTFLEKLAETEIDGVKLFKNANEIVPLEGDNRLVMAGVDLNAEAFRSVLRARLTTPEDISKTLTTLQKALRFITIHREILSSNVGRLFFARDRLDEVKESLHAA